MFLSHWCLFTCSCCHFNPLFRSTPWFTFTQTPPPNDIISPGATLPVVPSVTAGVNIHSSQHRLITTCVVVSSNCTEVSSHILSLEQHGTQFTELVTTQHSQREAEPSYTAVALTDAPPPERTRWVQTPPLGGAKHQKQNIFNLRKRNDERLWRRFSEQRLIWLAQRSCGIY